MDTVSDEEISTDSESSDDGNWFSATTSSTTGSSPDSLTEKCKKLREGGFGNFVGVQPQLNLKSSNLNSDFPQVCRRTKNERPTGYYQDIPTGYQSGPPKKKFTRESSNSCFRSWMLIGVVILVALISTFAFFRRATIGVNRYCGPVTPTQCPALKENTDWDMRNSWFISQFVSFVKNNVVPFLNPSKGLERILSRFGYYNICED